MTTAITKKPSCIFITGMSHSGSRMPVHMLDKHPDVTIGRQALKAQGEFAPLLEMFYRCIDAMPIHQTDLVIDRDEFTFIMDGYLQVMDTSKPYCVIKLPSYPLMCPELFVEYFEGDIQFLFTRRPAEKIVRSFVSRGEDKLFFESNQPETMRQLKLLALEKRQYFLGHVDPEAIFRAQVDYCELLRERWDAAHPEYAFTIIDVEKLATLPDYLHQLLDTMGLSTDNLDEMKQIIKPDRLLQKSAPELPETPLKKMLRDITPPALWQWVARRWRS